MDYITIQYKDDLISFSTLANKVKRFLISQNGVIVDGTDRQIENSGTESWVLKFMRISRTGLKFTVEINEGSFYTRVGISYNTFSERIVNSM
jgi:hypothetical protein